MSENEKRAMRIADLMLIYMQRMGTEDEPRELNFRDMLTDMMHYADVYGIDFNHELSMATDNYSEEV